jgi:hypothetical protein
MTLVAEKKVMMIMRMNKGIFKMTPISEITEPARATYRAGGA